MKHSYSFILLTFVMVAIPLTSAMADNNRARKIDRTQQAAQNRTEQTVDKRNNLIKQRQNDKDTRTEQFKNNRETRIERDQQNRKMRLDQRDRKVESIR